MNTESASAIEPAYVATRLLGGLGNQLFQYAAGKSLASRLGARLILDATGYRRHHDGRQFALGQYTIDAIVAWRGYFRSPAGSLVSLPSNISFTDRSCRIARAFYDRLLFRGGGKGHRRPCFDVLRESSFNYQPQFEDMTGQSYLNGYWQSPRYFENIAETIRSELQPAFAPTGANREWLDRIRQSTSVCLHVRRGDILPPESRGVCSASYYGKAIELIKQRVKDPRFFIFSEDWQWCRANLRIEDGVVVDANRSEQANEDLRLMAACKHHVIANSTLSWWAAWLAGHPYQIVIAPEPWYSSRSSTRDLLPKQWLRLPRN